MAERIETVPPRGKYPWREWTDGHVYRAKQGDDFHVGLEKSRSVLTNRATFENLLVVTRAQQLAEGTFMIFQFYKHQPGDLLSPRRNSRGTTRTA